MASNMAKVLIVEDDALIQRMYQQILTFDKHDVAVAGNGKEGLNKVSEVKPDIILLDIMMPEFNGLQMLQELKRNEDYKDIPVIMLTNLDDKKDIDAAMALGAQKYFVKVEQTPREVADMVKETLTQK